VSSPWAGALDDFEARLALTEAIIELGAAADPPPPFRVPDVTGPFPAELLTRAETLLHRARTVEQRLQAEQHRIREELARLPKVPEPQRRPARHFESTA